MNRPTIDEMLKNIDGKYALVVAAAKRARIITMEKGTKMGQTKAVTEALQEIAANKVHVVSKRPVEKQEM